MNSEWVIVTCQIEMQWQNWNDCAADGRPADSGILRIPVIFSAENRSV